jgi:hypothetical protein
MEKVLGRKAEGIHPGIALGLGGELSIFIRGQEICDTDYLFSIRQR